MDPHPEGDSRPSYSHPRQGGYSFAPIRRWIAFPRPLIPLTGLGSILAAIPMLFSASTSALAGGVISSANIGRNSIVTFETLASPYDHGCIVVGLIFRIPGPSIQSINTHPALGRIGSRCQAKSHCSRPTGGSPMVNGVPENGRIASIIEIVASGVSSCALGVVSLANSSAASCAFWLASSARTFAAPTLSSDRRLSSLWRRPAICPSIISRPTPSATKLFASDEPHCSKKESYGGWIAAMATSPSTPTTTSPPPNHSQRSHDSMDFSSSESLALVMPFGRRRAGKGFKGFWLGIGVGTLMFVILFAVHFLQREFQLAMIPNLTDALGARLPSSHCWPSRYF